MTNEEQDEQEITQAIQSIDRCSVRNAEEMYQLMMSIEKRAAQKAATEFPNPPDPDGCRTVSPPVGPMIRVTPRPPLLPLKTFDRCFQKPPEE